MYIGSVHFQPYIYNTNYINRNSMNKVSAISDDFTSPKTDFSNLTDEELNENPLRKGETAHFEDVFQMQFQKGQMNAARLIKPVSDTEESFSTQAYAQNQNSNTMQRAIEAYQAAMIA
ncbi:MAG: hypothetical protein HDR10_09195 [Lachnospiraceae bacterium]|nr:hypothetical protein [Lachnospiraceae bacterium]